MKKVVLAVAFVAVGMVSCKTEKKTNDKVKETVEIIESKASKIVKGNIDTKTSVVEWKGFKPTGSHNGTVSLNSGILNIEEGRLKSGSFIIDMNTINTLDLKAGDGKEDLNGHLKDEDFFNVAKYPTSKFVITSVDEKDGKLAVTGNLTVKETTKAITIPASISTVDGITTFKSDKFNVNRTEFDIKYKSKSFFNDLKNKFINDDIEFSFNVKTKK